MAQLRAIAGPLAGQTIEIHDELVIGRLAGDVTVDDPQVSRRHAVIRALGAGLEVEDLGSSNGTFVDGKRIETSTGLANGAQIRVGATVLLVEGLVPATSAATQTPVADPGATRIRDIRPPDSTRVSPLQPAAPDSTRVSARQPIAPDSTRVRPRQPPAPGPTRIRPAAPAAPGPPTAPEVGPVPSQPRSEFRPPERKRKSGLASRSWVPVVLSYGSVVVTAIALVIYFAAR